MMERVQQTPNIQVLSFNSPNRFAISQRSPSIRSDGPQIIALGAGRRQVFNQPQEQKLNSLKNILKIMHEWKLGTHVINSTEWLDAELKKYLLQIDRRFQNLYVLQKSLDRAFNFNDIVEKGIFYNGNILGITQMTNQRKIFAFASEQQQKFLNSIANAQISQHGLHLSHRINQQHLQSLNFISINERMREDLLRLKQQNSSDGRFNDRYETEIANLRIEETYEMIKQELGKSNRYRSDSMKIFSLQEDKNRKINNLEKQKEELLQKLRYLQQQVNKNKKQTTLSDDLVNYHQKKAKIWQQTSLKAQDKVRSLQRQNSQLRDKLIFLNNEKNDKLKAQSFRLQQLQILNQTQSKQIKALHLQLEKQRQNSLNSTLNRKLSSSQIELLTNKCERLAEEYREKQSQLAKINKHCQYLQNRLKDKNLVNNRQQILQQMKVKQLQEQNRSLKANYLTNAQILQKNQQSQMIMTEQLKQIEYHKGNTQKLAQQKQKAQFLYRKIKQQLFGLKKIIAQKQQTIDSLQKSIRTLQLTSNRQFSSQSQTRILQNRIKQIQQQRNKRIYELNQQRTQRSKLQQKIANQNSQIQDLNQQIQMLNKILEEKNELSMIRLQQQQLNHIEVKNTDKQRTMSLKIAQLQGGILKKDEQIIQLRQRIKEKDDQLSRLYQQNSLKDERIQKLNRQLNQLLKSTNNIKLQHQQTVSKCMIQKNQLQAKITKMSSQQLIPKRDSNNSNHVNVLFQHQLLYHHYEQKQFLIDVIEKQMRMEIAKTKLLFTFDPLNKTNFHQYIDEKSNIVIIIKLQNGYSLAAYSEGYFKPKHVSRDFGLIISLTNRKYFTLIDASKRAIYYDEYFLIFGNSQIRLKSQQNILFSNFGINNSSFNARGEKVNVLLGEGNNRQVPIETYEIYQITFNN